MSGAQFWAREIHKYVPDELVVLQIVLTDTQIRMFLKANGDNFK